MNTHCQKLWTIFTPYFPIVHTKYTCDLDMFFPEPAPKKNSKLVVGWTGSLKNHGSKRGFYDFIQPVCDQFPEIELKVQAREDKLITDDNEMRAWYNSLDLYFCASRSEGTPRPVIEAGACGVPVFSTDVGIVPELIDDGQNGYIVERTQEAMIQKLQQILAQRDELPEIGRALRIKMEREFNWTSLAQQWMDFFKLALELKKLRETGKIR
ncbi:glycosyltransferase family 4 protein [bacterium]|nr:glycosyltransferase family 4 protein [bacterium]